MDTATFLDFLAWHPPYGDDKGVLMVSVIRPGGLKGFFDESGIHDRASVCVIAGYVGSLNEWRRFDALWGPYANDLGFHAKEFFAKDPAGQRVKPYAGWTDAGAGDYLGHLLDAITSLKLYPVGALVDVRAFREYSEPERRLITGGEPKLSRAGTWTGKWMHSGAPTKPYFLAFWKAATEALTLLERNDWKVEFVFDRQDTYAPLALRLYDRLKVDLDEPRMGAATFESRHVAVGLQAADLIAHSWHQFGTYGHQARPEVHRILSAQRRDTLVAFTKDMMDKLVGRREPTPGTIYGYDPHTRSFRPEEKNTG